MRTSRRALALSCVSEPHAFSVLVLLVLGTGGCSPAKGGEALPLAAAGVGVGVAGSPGMVTSGAPATGMVAGAGRAPAARAGSGGVLGSSSAGAGGLAAGAAAATARAGGGGEAAAGSGGSGDVGPAAGSGGPGKVFAQCRFHFGAIADVARNNPAMIKELDFFTPGWMGLKDSFDMQHVCDDTKPGGMFSAQVPAIVSYVAAFYAKRTGNLKDCNASGAQQDLCVAGAKLIMQDLSKIVAIYENYAQGFAGCYGTTRPIIFMMEPDFYQYTISSQSQPWTAAQAGQVMGQFVNAIKKHLPNAVFSMDISPWVAPNNGEDQGKQWYANFDMKLFTFVNTSGGSTDGGTATIRGSNKMTWRGVSEATGKPVLADTGYGVNGRSAGHDTVWDDVNNINARIEDGVTSISQYNPMSNWGATIAALRAKLKAPKQCP